MTDENDRAMSMREAAKLLGISLAGAYQFAAEGKLHARKAGRRTLVLQSEIRRFLLALPVYRPSGGRGESDGDPAPAPVS